MVIDGKKYCWGGSEIFDSRRDVIWLEGGPGILGENEVSRQYNNI